METVIVFFIITLWGYLVIETLIRNKFNIEIKKGYSLYLNKFHEWAERLFITLAIVTLVSILLSGYDSAVFILAHIAIVILFLLVIFRAFMEWKREKETKRYMLTLLTFIFYLIFFTGVIAIISDSLGNLYTDNGVIRYEYGTTFAGIQSAIYIVGYRGTDTKITIPSRISNQPVLVIKNSAFARTPSLESVEIPYSVIFINRRAFFGNTNLSTIYFKSEGPPLIGDDAFTNICPEARAIIPSGTRYWPPEGSNWNGLIITYSDSDIYAYSSQ